MRMAFQLLEHTSMLAPIGSDRIAMHPGKLITIEGIDGAGNDGLNDGYVTVTAAQAFDAFTGIVYATV